MTVAIGRRHPSHELVDILLECHERIRRFGRVAVEIGSRADLPAADVVDACERCEGYFSEALPRHVEDEERSVLPRLRGLSPEVDAALARMADQHGEHGPQVSALCEALRAVRSDPTAVRPRAELLLLATRLLREFEEHLALEEEVIFPAVRALVPPDQQELAVEELRARRRPGAAAAHVASARAAPPETTPRPGFASADSDAGEE